MRSRLMRIDTDLADEIKQIAAKNNMKQIDVSREVARMLKSKKSFTRELIF